MRLKVAVLVLVSAVIGLQSQAVARAAATTTAPAGTIYTSCHFGDGAPVSAQCEKLRNEAVAGAQRMRTSASGSVQPAAGNIVNQNCNPSFSNITDVRAADDGVLSSQLDLVKMSSTNWCYFFWGSNGYANNNFDGEDDWYIVVRVWVCGAFKQIVPNEGQLAYGTAGPPAQVATAVWNYGQSCGPQADNGAWGSYAMVDYSKHYFPYVHF